MATYEAFNIYEIVDMILVNLTITEVARAQRVSKGWKGVIAESKSLKQILHLEAKPVESVLEWVRENESYKPRINNLNPPRAVSDFGGNRKLVITPHPILNTIRVITPDGDTTGQTQRTELFVDIDIVRLLLWPPGPWHQMFLTQPPTQKVTLSDTASFASDQVKIEHFEGVTFGMILSRVKEDVKSYTPRCTRLSLTLKQALSVESPWVAEAQSKSVPSSEAQKAAIIADLGDNTIAANKLRMEQLMALRPPHCRRRVGRDHKIVLAIEDFRNT